jgi:hypothetical protein
MHFVIDHAEQGPEEPSELVQVEDTNPEQEQGKPKCIWPPSLNFVYNYILFMILECALGYRNWIDTLVALWLLSNPPLWILLLEISH